jgi:sugar lactone lactonase YvrE
MARKALAALAAGVVASFTACNAKSAKEHLAERVTYAVDGSRLWRSGLAADGTDTLVGTVRLADGTVVAVTDAALTPDGTLYIVAVAHLYEVDPATAAATRIGTAPQPGALNALASDANGNLYGAGGGKLYAVDRATGAAAEIGAFGTNLTSSGDLVFDASGVLWASLHGTDPSHDTLATVDLATGAATLRHDLPLNTWGLSVAGGALFAFGNDGALYQIDPSTGTVTRLRSLAFRAYGST